MNTKALIEKLEWAKEGKGLLVGGNDFYNQTLQDIYTHLKAAQKLVESLEYIDRDEMSMEVKDALKEYEDSIDI